MPTPLWFGLADGKVYFRTYADAYKIKRIRNNPRGPDRPLRPARQAEGPRWPRRSARVVPEEEKETAERAVQSNYGLIRRIYKAGYSRQGRGRLRGGEPRMSRFEDPVIISNSISGAIANRDQCPAIPYTPEEYAAEARRAVDEGASQIHIHARTPDGTPSYEIEDFQAITEAIRAEVDDVIINYSTGAIGVPIEKRLEYLRALKPDVAALNMSSMNYAKYSRRRKDFVFKAVFENSFDLISAVHDRDDRARDPARARVLRRRATSPTSIRSSTWGC